MRKSLTKWALVLIALNLEMAETKNEEIPMTINTNLIADLIGSNPFFIDSSQVEELLQHTGMSKQAFLQELIPIAKKFARPPISNYYVGAALLGKSGNIYLGVNLEFPGFHLNQCIHGEQFAIVLARLLGETEIEAIALSAAPCGHCRQFMNELGKDLDILTPHQPPRKLSELLPEAFGPKDLGLEGNLLTQSNSFESDHPDALFAEAVKACRASYAPYSKCPAGVAIQTHDGAIYVGHYLENAAFNPTVSPFQSALIALIADQRSYENIAKVVLVEYQPPQKTGHALFTQSLLNSIAPEADFEFISLDI